MAQQELYPSGTEYYRLFSPLGSPGGSAKGVLAKGLAAVAALALAAAGFFHLYVDCTPLSITSTTALLETQLYNLEEEEEVSWFLIEGSDLTTLPPPEDWDLTLLLDLLTEIFLEDLEPGREYTIIYTTPNKDGVPEIIHTFTFRTPIGPPNLAPPTDSGDGSDEPPTPPEPPQTPSTPQTPSEPSEPSEPPKTPPVTPPPGGGSGGGNDGGGSGGGTIPSHTPPAASGSVNPELNSADSLGESGSYGVPFTFALNGNTPNKVVISGSVRKRSAWSSGSGLAYEAITPVTYSLADMYYDKDYDEAGATYSVPSAFWDSKLTATLYYTDVNGNSHSITSPEFSYSPTFLHAGSSHTLSVELREGTLHYTMAITGAEVGSHNWMWVGYNANNGKLESADNFQCQTTSDGCILTFTIPMANTYGDQTYAANVELGLYGIMGGPITLDGSYTSPDAPAVFPVAVGRPVLEFHGLSCYDLTLDVDATAVTPGQTVTLTAWFNGTATESFTLSSGTSLTALPHSASPVEVAAGDTGAVFAITFTMPNRMVTDTDFDFSAITAQVLSTFAAEPEDPPAPATSEKTEESLPEPSALEETENPLPEPPVPEEETPDTPAT